MNTNMFPLQVQKAIANLHIAFAAGRKINKVYSELNSTESMLKKSIETDVITFCDTIEANRVEGINKLIDDLSGVAEKKTKSVCEIYKSIMGSEYNWREYSPSAFATAYEGIIEQANNEGAEIYDACVTYSQKHSVELLDEAIEAALDISEKEGFKLHVVCTYDNERTDYKGEIFFYTTTKGTVGIKKALKTLDSYWDHEQTHTYYYALPLFSSTLDAQIKTGFDRSKHSACALDSNALIQNEDNRSHNEEIRLEEVGRIFSKHGETHVNYEKTNFVDTETNKKYYPIDDVVDNADHLGISDWVIDSVK